MSEIIVFLLSFIVSLIFLLERILITFKVFNIYLIILLYNLVLNFINYYNSIKFLGISSLRIYNYFNILPILSNKVRVIIININ